MPDAVIVENINTPGRTESVRADKYHAMRDAMMAVMGDEGMTAKEIREAALPHLPGDLFPGGATSGWWMKTVQLDLEAKGLVRRHPTKPLTFSRT